MEKYKIGKTLGDGTFGKVFLAINEITGEQVAIKKMKQKKFPQWDEILLIPEIICLQQLRHPNIIELREVIKLNNELYLVFEFLHINVYQLLKENIESKKPIDPFQIRNIMFQTLKGLEYIHQKGYFHRDLKPENLLYNKNTEEVKIADLGLAKMIESKGQLTDYVSTRWYRAPELILKTKKYDQSIDVFALGCIMAELYLQWPLFPGVNERDMIERMAKSIDGFGQWREGIGLARRLGLDYKMFQVEAKSNLQGMFRGFEENTIGLIIGMLQWDPKRRLTATQCLMHPYFYVTPISQNLAFKKESYQEIEQSFNQNNTVINVSSNTQIDIFSNLRYKPD